MRLWPAAVLSVITWIGASDARAALTSSEKAQIRDFVTGARSENANKVRSLVARTDLTPEESSGVLVEALAGVAFTDARGTFLKEVVFAGASAPSRPVTALAVVKGLVARADAVFQRYVGGLDREPRAVQELGAIYAWLDANIANAGKPTPTEHDVSAGIPAAGYDECSKVLRAHVDHNARWLKGLSPVPDAVSRLRAQAQTTLVDMLPDGVTRRVDAGDRLGLTGARRTMLVDWGILLADAGKIDDAKAERVRQLVARLPGARADLALLYVGDDRSTTLVARGAVLDVSPGAERYPFVDETPPPAYDAVTGAIAHDLADRLAKRVLDAKAELRAQAELDAKAASGDLQRLLGRPRAPSVDHVVGAAVHTLLVDGAKAIELSASRFQGLRPQTAALLSDAIGVLALSSAEGGGKQRVDVGKGAAWAPLTVGHLMASGPATAFTLEGHAWTIERGPPAFAASGVRRDGNALPQK